MVHRKSPMLKQKNTQNWSRTSRCRMVTKITGHQLNHISNTKLIRRRLKFIFTMKNLDFKIKDLNIHHKKYEFCSLIFKSLILKSRFSIVKMNFRWRRINFVLEIWFSWCPVILVTMWHLEVWDFFFFFDSGLFQWTIWWYERQMVSPDPVSDNI